MVRHMHIVITSIQVAKIVTPWAVITKYDPHVMSEMWDNFQPLPPPMATLASLSSDHNSKLAFLNTLYYIQQWEHSLVKASCNILYDDLDLSIK